jgi:hypothetical protein
MARGKRTHSDPFDHARFLPYIRSKFQAIYRKEAWDLEFSEWCEFWSTPAIWARRGRAGDSLCLTRIEEDQSWSKDNCVLVFRVDHLKIKILRKHGKDYQAYIEEVKIK